MRGRSLARGVGPVRGGGRGASPKPKIDARKFQVPPEFVVGPLL